MFLPPPPLVTCAGVKSTVPAGARACVSPAAAFVEQVDGRSSFYIFIAPQNSRYVMFFLEIDTSDANFVDANSFSLAHKSSVIH